MAGVIYKGVRATDGRKAQLTAADSPQNAAGTSVLVNELGAANGIPTLNGSSLVVQNPASASASATPSTIALRDSNGDVIVALTPTAAGAAASKSYVDTLSVQGRSWKELLLVPEQLVAGGAGGISQALLVAIAVDLAPGDTFIITDGSTTETFTGVGAAPAAFQFVAGSGITTTTANLVAAINADSTLWSAVTTTGLGTYFSSPLDPSIVVYRTLATTGNADRVYGVIAGAQSDIQVIQFGSNTFDYAKPTPGQIDLPAADPVTQYAGFGRATAGLLPGETHQTVESSSAYTWDADDAVWQQTSSPASANPSKGSDTYAASAPDYAEANALLPSVGNFGYFYKGATDTVYHLFRRSTVAGTLADFAIVEMT